MAATDLTDFVGLAFVAQSGNSCITKLIGQYGLRIQWKHKESDEDVREFEKWFAAKAGIPPEQLRVTEIRQERGEPAHVINRREQEAYKRYVERHAKPERD
jgi:hypothetical protein